MERTFELLKIEVQKFLGQDSSGHDASHAERVFNTARYLQSIEGGDMFIIGCSALAHDMCRPFEKETGKSHFGPEALEIIRVVLQNIGINFSEVQKILELIALHDIYDEKDEDKSLELKILQDADRLDAIGAIGIARTFMFGGVYGAPLWLPGENLTFTEAFKEIPGKKTSTIAHFYEKLLKLSGNMNTVTGKQMAENRHQYMLEFLDQFFSEWNGER